MKRKFVLEAFVMLILVVSMPNIVYAQEEEADLNPGIIRSGSPIYFLDVFVDDIRYNFTSEQDKVRIGLEIADERLAEIQASNISESIQNAERNRERIMEKLKDRNNTEQEQEQIRERLQKHQEVLQQVRERVPQEAKESIDNAIEHSNINIQDHFQKALGNKIID